MARLSPEIIFGLGGSHFVDDEAVKPHEAACMTVSALLCQTCYDLDRLIAGLKASSCNLLRARALFRCAGQMHLLQIVGERHSLTPSAQKEGRLVLIGLRGQFDKEPSTRPSGCTKEKTD